MRQSFLETGQPNPAMNPEAADGGGAASHRTGASLTGPDREGTAQVSDNSLIKLTLTPPSGFHLSPGSQMLKQTRQSVCSL